MNKVVSIKSSLEFVVVGPTSISETGILIKSNNVDIDLIGIANLAYHGKLPGRYESDMLYDEDVQIVYSDPRVITNRAAEILFVYRSKLASKMHNFNQNQLMQVMNRRKQLTSAFDNFLENSTIELVNLVQTNAYPNHGYQAPDESLIAWHISPLLLLSMKA